MSRKEDGAGCHENNDGLFGADERKTSLYIDDGGRLYLNNMLIRNIVEYKLENASGELPTLTLTIGITDFQGLGGQRR